MDGLAHWDDTRTFDADFPPVRGRWRNLGAAARSTAVGVQRIDVAPGHQSTPVHAHGNSEEIFYVLEGAGFLWMDGTAWAVGPGDCIVHRARTAGHTIVGGPDGVSVLAFGTRPGAEPALHVRSDTAVVFGFRTREHPEHPWSLEAGLDVVDVSSPSPDRPRSVVALGDLQDGAERRDRAGVHREIVRLGRVAGARESGLTHYVVDPRSLANVPHCHSAEEEIFVILEGDGTLELWDAHAESVGSHPLRAGSVVVRPPGTGISHSIRAGANGMRMLGYSDRHPDDACFYPRSQNVALSGLGILFRVTQVDYFDGEE
jgi:uncharacterized cupin superfamily protein